LPHRFLVQGNGLYMDEDSAAPLGNLPGITATIQQIIAQMIKEWPGCQSTSQK
jgi:hypothetical protein